MELFFIAPRSVTIFGSTRGNEMAKRRPLIVTSASNPNAQYMEFTHLNRYNDEHPDELHREWLRKNKPRVGRARGEKVCCTRCGYEGHYRSTCTRKFDVLGVKIYD